MMTSGAKRGMIQVLVSPPKNVKYSNISERIRHLLDCSALIEFTAQLARRWRIRYSSLKAINCFGI